MSKLNDLINKLCPHGVEYKTLQDCLIDQFWVMPQKPKYQENGIPYITSKNISDGIIDFSSAQFISEEDYEIASKNRKILVDDILISMIGTIGEIAIVKKSDGKFYGQNMYLIRLDTNKLSTRFFYHFFNSEKMKQYFQRIKNASSQGYLKQEHIAKILIPIPPLEVQNEIIFILDKFASLEEELKAELEARRKQYEWAKQKLLNIKKENVFELQELCHIEKGKTPIQKAIPGEFPLVVTTDKRSSCIDYQFDCKAVCLSLVSARGHGIAQISRIFYQEGKFALGNILCAMIPKNENFLNAKYLRYYLFYMKDILLTPLMKGGANVALHISDLQTVKIPIPPLEEQERIVSILDRFESICNDITSGLPAEIEARHKQHEYYRDKLLTFKRKEA